jgi:phosphoserine phosphatase RsbU/P
MSSEVANFNVLIGEDQPEVQHALRLLLKNAGYKVESASTPDAILTHIESTPFDLILMDLNYRRDTTSGSEGLEVLGALRKLPSPPPVIVMTAWGSIELAVQAMHLGARDFIQKPWENSHLLHMIERHISTDRAERVVRRRQQHELDEAVKVQKRLLPTEFPTLPGVEIAGICQPAGAMAGDYYDVFQLGSKIGLCIADVIGKGLPAALMMSNLQAAVKVTAAEWITPSELCRRVNQLACRNGAVDKFISFFFATYEPRSRRLTYCNAGHNPPVVVRRNGDVVHLGSEDVVLGQMPDWHFHDRELMLEPGDRLVLFTDGITDAGIHKDDEFGDERLLQTVRTNSNMNARDLLERIVESVTSHCDQRFDDDATCLVMSVEAQATLAAAD